MLTCSKHRGVNLQGMPYAIFGTCLGAIIGYEIIRVARREGLPLPVAFFPAAVSPPHLYSVAVMKLYLVNPLKPGERPPQALYDQVLTRLKNWHSLTKEQMIMVPPPSLSTRRRIPPPLWGQQLLCSTPLFCLEHPRAT